MNLSKPLATRRVETVLDPVQERFEQLWVYWPRLVAFARGRGASSTESEDVASLTVVRVATSGRIDEEIGNPWPYLATVAANLMRDRHRRAAMEEIASRDARLIPLQRGFEGDVANRDLGARALRRLYETEPTLTVALVLRRIDGYTWSEMGDEFGIGASAVQSRVRRALLRLARWMEYRHSDEKDLG